MKPSRVPKRIQAENTFGKDGEKKVTDPTTNASVEIAQVANGFIVRPGGQWFNSRMRGDEPRMWPDSEASHHVFRTFAELSTWLGRHFTHRSKKVQVDR